jgi:ADP-heptose:LPS heptosyltransferase
MKKLSLANLFWFLVINLDFLGIGLLLDGINYFKKSFSPRKILVVRLDSIGDYVLFRNFLASIKPNPAYKNYKLTLAGNIVWKDLAETFDNKFVDNFIWINQEKFRSNVIYCLKILLKIRWAGFSVAVQPTLSRGLIGDRIIKASKAKIRIGSEGYLNNILLKDKIKSDRYYTKLIALSADNYFEFRQNKFFFENFLNHPLTIVKPFFDMQEAGITLPVEIKEKYVVLFPGAQTLSRRWSPEKFGQIAKLIFEKYGIRSTIAGSADDLAAAKQIKTAAGEEKIIDLTANLSLSQLVKLIAGATMLISNDTCAVHIALSLDLPAICISNGNHFGRFTNCPQEISQKISYIYVPEIQKNLSAAPVWREKFKIESNLDINKISVSDVENLITKIIGQNEQ